LHKSQPPVAHLSLSISERMDFSRIDLLQEGETADSRAMMLLEELKAGKISVADLMGPISHLPNLSPQVNIPPGDKSVFPAAKNAEFFPKDAHNDLLEHHVHPHDYENPQPDDCYDLVVIGAGAAGLISSIMGAWLGKKVALIEEHAMGGDCLNSGCVPSKALIACAKAVHTVKDLEKYGVKIEGQVSTDFGFVMERMRGIRATISHHDSVQRYSRDFCRHVFIGHAHFSDSNTVTVQGEDGTCRLLSFNKAMIATGASAAIPAELRDIPHLTNSSLFNLTALPPRICIIGCGPIGMEMAQSMARFGSIVHCFERFPRLLMREDAEAVNILQGQLEKDGKSIIGISYVC
jgi:hypothetical protein